METEHEILVSAVTYHSLEIVEMAQESTTIKYHVSKAIETLSIVTYLNLSVEAKKKYVVQAFLS